MGYEQYFDYDDNDKSNVEHEKRHVSTQTEHSTTNIESNVKQETINQAKHNSTVPAGRPFLTEIQKFPRKKILKSVNADKKKPSDNAIFQRKKSPIKSTK